MQDNKMNDSFILASGSPRRRDLLGQLGLSPRIIKPDVDEAVREGEPPHEFVLRTAREKGDAVCSRHGVDSGWVLSADTTVVLGEEILGKPRDERDAVAMLRKLSGQKHRVLTGVCLRYMGGDTARIQEGVVLTEVSFKELSDEEIERYVATGDPLDKAGSYSIQGPSSYFVRAIEGSYTNVVGLPLTEVFEWITGIIMECNPKR